MRLLLLSLVLLVGACATTSTRPPVTGPALSASADTTEARTADVQLVGYPEGGAQMSVSFRAEVPISPAEPAVLVVDGERFSAPLDAAPSTVRGDGVVTSAAYRLSARGRAVAEAAGDRVQLLLHDGTAYRSYGVRRTDILE